MVSDQTQFLLLINFVLLSLQLIIIKTIGKDSDEKRDAQLEVLTDEVMQTQHPISQDISLPLTITYMNTKRKKCNAEKLKQSIDIILSSLTYVVLSMEK